MGGETIEVDIENLRERTGEEEGENEEVLGGEEKTNHDHGRYPW